MKELTNYLNSMSRVDQESYARRCGTTIGYLRKASSIGQRLRESLCIALDRESGGSVRCEALRPDVDWGYLLRRSTPPVITKDHS